MRVPEGADAVIQPPNAPPRPDRQAGRRPTDRHWWPAFAAVAVIGIVVLGGYAVAGALAEPAGPPVGFRGVVSVRPLSGWSADEQLEVLGAPGIRLTRGGGNLDLIAVPGSETPELLAQRYADHALPSQLERVRVSDRLEPVALAAGVPAVRFEYIGVLTSSGASIEGQVTAAVTVDGDGVVFDGWAPQGLLPFVRDDIQTMVARAQVA
jgi:hypothetical protein